jgi:hypothetical protein
MGEHISHNGAAARGEPLTEREAIGRALWLVEEKYSEPAGSVCVDSIQLIEGTQSTLHLHSLSRRTYELDLTLQDDLVTLARIKRARP